MIIGKRSRKNTSRVIIGSMEPITSPQGTTQPTTFSPFGASDGNAPLTMLESQSPSTDQEAIESLELLSGDFNLGDSQTNDIPDLSASQKIIDGTSAFQVDDEKLTRKNHSVVKDVSRDYLYCYHPFLQCLLVVLLGCITIIISYFDCN